MFFGTNGTMQPATVIYLDPARRNDNGAKTVAISDCTPNLLSLLEDLLRKSWVTLVKLSPMLDWHQAVVQLNTLSNCVRQVHIIAVNNECKELLFVLSSHRLRCIVSTMSKLLFFILNRQLSLPICPFLSAVT